MNCYRFDSRDSFRALAAAEGLVDASNNLILCSHTHAIDEVAWVP